MCFSCGDVSAFRCSNPRLVSLVVDGHGGSLAGRAQMARPPYVYGTIFYITIVSDHAEVTIYLIV